MKRVRIRRLIRIPQTRSGTALLATLFVMTVASAIVVAILETQASQYASLRNTIQYDQSRYLAEAGLSQALAQLEGDITWRGTVSRTEFPTSSGNYFEAIVEDGSAGTVVVTGMGDAGGIVRTVQVIVKQGG